VRKLSGSRSCSLAEQFELEHDSRCPGGGECGSVQESSFSRSKIRQSSACFSPGTTTRCPSRCLPAAQSGEFRPKSCRHPLTCFKFRFVSSPLLARAQPNVQCCPSQGSAGVRGKETDWLNLTLAQLPRRKAISRSTPFPRSRTMSERHTGPVSQTLRATGSTCRRRIGPRGRAGNRDKRRIADGVRWRYDAPGECTLLQVRFPRECRSWL
jgi:hypothetical protein